MIYFGSPFDEAVASHLVLISDTCTTFPVLTPLKISI